MVSVMDVAAAAMRLARQAVAVDANDLANLDTPGFRGELLRWQDALAQAARQGPGALAAVTGTPVVAPGVRAPDGNGVSLVATMADLARDQTLAGVAAQALLAAAGMDRAAVAFTAAP